MFPKHFPECLVFCFYATIMEVRKILLTRITFWVNRLPRAHHYPYPVGRNGYLIFESVFLGVWRLQCIIHLRPPVPFAHNYHCHVLCQPHHEIFTWSATFLVVSVFFTHYNASFAAILVTERVCYKYYAKVRLGKLRPNAFVRRTDAWVSRMRHTGALFPLAIAYTSLKQNFSNIISSFSLIYTY